MCVMCRVREAEMLYRVHSARPFLEKVSNLRLRQLASQVLA